MKLEKYSGKKVRVVGTNGEVYVGTVDLYTQPNDNDGMEAIAIFDCGVWLDEEDIKSIQLA